MGNGITVTHANSDGVDDVVVVVVVHAAVVVTNKEELWICYWALSHEKIHINITKQSKSGRDRERAKQQKKNTHKKPI